MSYLSGGILYLSVGKPIEGLPYLVQFHQNGRSFYTALDANGDCWSIHKNDYEVTYKKMGDLRNISQIYTERGYLTSAIDSNGKIPDNISTFDKKIIKTCNSVVLTSEGIPYYLRNGTYKKIDIENIQDIAMFGTTIMLLDHDGNLWTRPKAIYAELTKIHIKTKFLGENAIFDEWDHLFIWSDFDKKFTGFGNAIPHLLSDIIYVQFGPVGIIMLNSNRQMLKCIFEKFDYIDKLEVMCENVDALSGQIRKVNRTKPARID